MAYPKKNFSYPGPSMWFSNRINWIISDVQAKKFFLIIFLASNKVLAMLGSWIGTCSVFFIHIQSHLGWLTIYCDCTNWNHTNRGFPVLSSTNGTIKLYVTTVRLPIIELITRRHSNRHVNVQVIFPEALNLAGPRELNSCILFTVYTSSSVTDFSDSVLTCVYFQKQSKNIWLT